MAKRLHLFLSALALLATIVVAVDHLLASGGSAVAGQPVLVVPHEATTTPDITQRATSSVSTNAFIVRAVDGDTLVAKIDGETKESRIRLLGINTPETVDPRKTVECFGHEASAHMHAMIDGKRVLLKGDPQADERDKYDRLLRNVFLEDGTDVNAAMVRDGYAYAYLSFPLSPERKRELKRLQDDAQAAGRGLWSPETCNGKK